MDFELTQVDDNVERDGLQICRVGNKAGFAGMRRT